MRKLLQHRPRKKQIRGTPPVKSLKKIGKDLMLETSKALKQEKTENATEEILGVTEKKFERVLNQYRKLAYFAQQIIVFFTFEASLF